MWFFLLQSLEKYLKIFDNIGIDIKLIENKDNIVRKISNIDLELLSKKELIFYYRDVCRVHLVSHNLLGTGGLYPLALAI